MPFFLPHGALSTAPEGLEPVFGSDWRRLSAAPG